MPGSKRTGWEITNTAEDFSPGVCSSVRSLTTITVKAFLVCIFQQRSAEQSELCWKVMENSDPNMCYWLDPIRGHWKLNT